MQMSCCSIDDHDIELYIMGKLEDESIRAHLTTCSACAARIGEAREYIAAMKQALLGQRHTDN